MLPPLPALAPPLPAVLGAPAAAGAPAEPVPAELPPMLAGAPALPALFIVAPLPAVAMGVTPSVELQFTSTAESADIIRVTSARGAKE